MKLMNKAMRYIFYKFYVFSLIFWGKEREPHVNATMMMMFTYYSISFLFVALISILLNTNKIYDSLFNFVDAHKYVLFPYVLLMYLIAYFQFAMKGKYKKIYKEFKNETRFRRIVGNIIATAYFFGSLGFALWLLRLSNSLIK